MVTEERNLVVSCMEDADADPLTLLISDIIESLSYYNQVAKESERKKYSAKLLLESANNQPGSVLVAKIEGELAGFCVSEEDDGVIWLAWFGVHPRFRRRGIGAVLLNALEDFARNKRFQKIWCDCRTENEISKTALRKQGYVVLCTVTNHWYGQDFILWEKLVA